jgi:hypothetical protein
VDSSLSVAMRPSRCNPKGSSIDAIVRFEMNAHRSNPRSSHWLGHRDLLRGVLSWCIAAPRAASRQLSTFSVSSSGSKLKPKRRAMSHWNDAIAKYLANEENRDGSKIFAKLNAIRCEFAIRSGHGSYVTLRDDASREMVYINWQFFEMEGLVVRDLDRRSGIEIPAERAASKCKPSLE